MFHGFHVRKKNRNTHSLNLKIPTGFEVPTAVVMNVAIFWDIAPCSSYANRCSGRTYHLHLQGKNQPSKKPACSRYLATYGLNSDISQQMATCNENP
jgi:hypothetical protein